MGKPECRRCGRCCAVKLIVDDTVIYTDEYCRYLDPQTRTCTVYERRHEVNPECLPLEEAVRMRLLPADCPFVADVPDYVPPITLAEFLAQSTAEGDEDMQWLEADPTRQPES